jgi:hypothetical protein
MSFFCGGYLIKCCLVRFLVGFVCCKFLLISLMRIAWFVLSIVLCDVVDFLICLLIDKYRHDRWSC